MEGLPKDIRKYMVHRFLTLGSIRNLLCVSKSYYMMFKFYVKIQTVPFGGSYTPIPCVICDSQPIQEGYGNWAVDVHHSKRKLSKRSLDRIAPKNTVVECVCGHRYLCHAKDQLNGTCPKCHTLFKKIKF